MPPRANRLGLPSFGNGERAEPVEIWKARKFIHEHSDEKLGLTKVAKSVNISANHLSEKFKEVTGVKLCRLHRPHADRESVRALAEFKSAD